MLRALNNHLVVLPKHRGRVSGTRSNAPVASLAFRGRERARRASPVRSRDGPRPTASGAARGSSETDELLVKDAPPRGADVRTSTDAGPRRRESPCASPPWARARSRASPVSGDVFGRRGRRRVRRVRRSRATRRATRAAGPHFDLADDSAFSLRDGKRGAWGAARGVSGAAPKATPSRRPPSATRGVVPSLRSAPALPRRSLLVPEVGPPPYEYEMPAVAAEPRGRGRGRVGNLGEPRDRTRLGVARERSLRDRRFDAAALGTRRSIDRKRSTPAALRTTRRPMTTLTLRNPRNLRVRGELR